MRKARAVKKCEDCQKMLRHWNVSGFCSACYTKHQTAVKKLNKMKRQKERLKARQVWE